MTTQSMCMENYDVERKHAQHRRREPEIDCRKRGTPRVRSATAHGIRFRGGEGRGGSCPEAAVTSPNPHGYYDRPFPPRPYADPSSFPSLGRPDPAAKIKQATDAAPVNPTTVSSQFAVLTARFCSAPAPRQANRSPHHTKRPALPSSGIGRGKKSSGLAAGGMDRIVGRKFKLGRKIGSGSFGVIYLGERSFDSPPPPAFGLCIFPFDSIHSRLMMLLLLQPRIWTPTRSSR